MRHVICRGTNGRNASDEIVPQRLKSRKKHLGRPGRTHCSSFLSSVKLYLAGAIVITKRAFEELQEPLEEGEKRGDNTALRATSVTDSS